MACFYRSKPLMSQENLLGHTKRECLEYGEKERCLCVVCVLPDARAIRNNGCLSELELEAIKTQVEGKCQDEVCKEQNVAVDAEATEIDVGTVEEGINDAEDSIDNTEGDWSEEHQVIVDKLKKKMI